MTASLPITPDSTTPGWRVRGTALVLNVLLGVRILLSLGVYVLIARRFGTSTELDAYWLAITPPLVLINLMEAAGVAASINYFTSLAQKPEDEQRTEVAGYVYAWVIVGCAIAALQALMAPLLAAKLGPGLTAPQQAHLAGLLRLSSIAMLAGPATVLGTVGILRVSGRFVTAAMVALIPPAIQIAALLAGVTSVQGLTAAFGLAYVGTALFAYWQLHLVRRPAWHAPSFAGRGILLRQLPPLVLAELLLQLIYVRERSLASYTEAGAISAMALALRLVAALGSLVSAGVEHTLAPTVALLHSSGDHRLARASVLRATVAVGAFTLVPGIALLVAPQLWVRLAFRRGAFDEASVALTSTVLVCYFGVYVFNSIGRVLIAATMSQRRVWRCAAINASVLALYLVLAPALGRSAGVAGLALSTSIALGTGTLLYASLVSR